MNRYPEESQVEDKDLRRLYASLRAYAITTYTLKEDGKVNELSGIPFNIEMRAVIREYSRRWPFILRAMEQLDQATRFPLEGR